MKMMAPAHHFMENRWANQNSDRLYFLGSKITADGNCSHEIKTHLLLGRKAMTIPRQCIKKQRHYFANKVHIVKAMVFPVIMYGCESWAIKKAEHQIIDAFELWAVAAWAQKGLEELSHVAGQEGRW